MQYGCRRFGAYAPFRMPVGGGFLTTIERGNGMTQGTSAHGGTLPAGRADAAAEPGAMLAQMQHELRTPLNAVIGYSEAMLCELHGPLGHIRYREYAAHIGESGGRLLKAAEEALAVIETLSARLAERENRIHG